MGPADLPFSPGMPETPPFSPGVPGTSAGLLLGGQAVEDADRQASLLNDEHPLGHRPRGDHGGREGTADSSRSSQPTHTINAGTTTPLGMAEPCQEAARSIEGPLPQLPQKRPADVLYKIGYRYHILDCDDFGEATLEHSDDIPDYLILPRELLRLLLELRGWEGRNGARRRERRA